MGSYLNRTVSLDKIAENNVLTLKGNEGKTVFTYRFVPIAEMPDKYSKMFFGSSGCQGIKRISSPAPVYEQEVCETCRHKDRHNEEWRCHTKCGPFGEICGKVDGMDLKVQCPQDHLKAGDTLSSSGVSG